MVVAGSSAVLAGCLAPTLPLPPPEQPTIQGPDASGLVTLSGRPGAARPNAEVTVWNPALDDGRGEGRTTIARSDGSWSESIPAARGQLLYVWQTVGFERSQQLQVKVP